MTDLAAHTNGDCFRAAFDDLMGWAARGGDMDALELVHGIVEGQGPLNGLRFVHAWVEARDSNGAAWARDSANGKLTAVPRELYYLLGGIEPATCVVRYTWAQARERAVRLGHYGPWDSPAADHADPSTALVARTINANTAAAG